MNPKKGTVPEVEPERVEWVAKFILVDGTELFGKPEPLTDEEAETVADNFTEQIVTAKAIFFDASHGDGYHIVPVGHIRRIEFKRWNT